MYHPTLSEVRGLAGQGNLLPVWRELPADLETPVSVYLKLRGEGPSFLLESVEKGEQVGRYSFLGIEPTKLLTASNGRISLWEKDTPHPLDWVGLHPFDLPIDQSHYFPNKQHPPQS